MRYDAVSILSAGDMATSSLTSNGIDLQQIFGCSIQAIFTGSPVGTLKLQVSNDIVQPGVTTGSVNPAANVVNWTDLTGSSVSVAAAGNFTWILPDVPYRWIQMVYTKVSGTGSLSANFMGKGL